MDCGGVKRERKTNNTGKIWILPRVWG